VDPQGIEPWSVSRRVSLSFTCVVAMSLATEFEDSAYDLSPCLSHLIPESAGLWPALVVDNPTRYQDNLAGDRLKLLTQLQQLHCRSQLYVSRLIKSGSRAAHTRENLPSDVETGRARSIEYPTPSRVGCPEGP